MNALIYDGPWQLHLAELPRPEPGAGEVLLRSIAVGICGSDVHGFTGESGRRRPGMVMGHEVVGEVVALGPGVDALAVGDRVAVFNIVGCGTCAHCTNGQEQRCPGKRVLGVNAGTWGAMADFFAFPVAGLFKIPPGIDPAIGLLTEPFAVAIHAIDRMAPARDEVVAIVGAGTIGIGLAIALRARGAMQVFALDRIPAKLALIAQFGATPVNVDEADAATVIRAATNGRGAAGVFEAVGAAATVRAAYDLCASGGTLVLVGNLAHEFTLPLQGVTSNETTIRGSYGFNRQDFAAAVAIVSDPSFAFNRLISGSCTLAETPEVMTRMARGELNPIKMVIRP
jgi:L-iditol 2-dehydrogenase